MANEKFDPVDHSYIDGAYAASYWSVVEDAREWEETEGFNALSHDLQDKLDNRPTWTYDANGMMVSYE